MTSLSGQGESMRSYQPFMRVIGTMDEHTHICTECGQEIECWMEECPIPPMAVCDYCLEDTGEEG